MTFIEQLKKLRSATSANNLLTQALMNPSMLVDVDERLGVYPAMVLSKLFQQLTTEQKKIIAKASVQLLRSWIEDTCPSKTAREELLYFLGEIRHENTEIMTILNQLIAHKKALQLDNPENRDLHARLLACLLDYQEFMPSISRKDFTFWFEQCKLLGDGYEALIWNGMVQFAPEKASKHLFDLVKTKEAAQRVRMLFPWAQEQIFKKIIESINFPSVVKSVLVSGQNETTQSFCKPIISGGSLFHRSSAKSGTAAVCAR